MATFLEIKQVLKEIFNLESEVDETCDIIIPTSRFSSRESDIILSNIDLKNAFDNFQNYNTDKLELSTQKYREVALQHLGPMARGFTQLDPIVDSNNGLTYSIGPASGEYSIFLLNEIAECFKTEVRRSVGNLKSRIRIILRHNIRRDADNENSM